MLSTWNCFSSFSVITRILILVGLNLLSRLFSGCHFSSCAIISIVGILHWCQSGFAPLILMPGLGAVGSGADPDCWTALCCVVLECRTMDRCGRSFRAKEQGASKLPEAGQTCTAAKSLAQNGLFMRTLVPIPLSKTLLSLTQKES